MTSTKSFRTSGEFFQQQINGKNKHRQIQLVSSNDLFHLFLRVNNSSKLALGIFNSHPPCQIKSVWGSVSIFCPKSVTWQWICRWANLNQFQPSTSPRKLINTGMVCFTPTKSMMQNMAKLYLSGNLSAYSILCKTTWLQTWPKNEVDFSVSHWSAQVDVDETPFQPSPTPQSWINGTWHWWYACDTHGNNSWMHNQLLQTNQATF